MKNTLETPYGYAFARILTFMFGLFSVAVAWFHQVEQACFSFILHSGMFVEAENFTKLCDIIRTSAICGFSLSLLVMTNFQFCCYILDSGMLRRLSVLTQAVCKAPQRHSGQELHWAEQNRTTFATCLGEWQAWSERRDVSGFDQYPK